MYQVKQIACCFVTPGEVSAMGERLKHRPHPPTPAMDTEAPLKANKGKTEEGGHTTF